MIALDELNSLPVADFVAALGAIFEHSPWVAERAAAARPFSSRLALLDAMRDAVEHAGGAEQMALIRAHPRLGAQGLARAALTRSSAKEQQGAGLESCTPEDLRSLEELNDAYDRRFAMPFILAVRGHGPQSIIAAMRRRLQHAAAAECGAALRQIGLIAGFRLADLVAAPAAGEVVAMEERLRACGAAAAGDGGTPDELVREWMLAAGFEVFAAGNGYWVARRRCGAAVPAGPPLLLGAYEEGADLRLAGQSGYLCSIAVAHALKNRGTQLPFDLILIARPVQPVEAGAASILGALREVGLGACNFLRADRGLPDALHGRTAACNSLGLAEAAVLAVENFLLRAAAPPCEYRG